MYEAAHIPPSRFYLNSTLLGMLFRKQLAYIKDQSTEKLHLKAIII